MNSNSEQDIISRSSDFIIDGTILKKYTGKAVSVIIPEGITEIGKDAFLESCVQTVSFPASLRVIGQCTFFNSGLKSLVIAEDMALTIDVCAFDNCKDLRFVEIRSNHVHFISDNDFTDLPFSGCSPSAAFILSDAFRNEHSLKLFRETSAVEEICETEREEVHPQLAVQYRLIRFASDYYLEINTTYYEDYAYNEECNIYPLNDLPPQWEPGMLADFAEKHMEDFWFAENPAEPIRTSPAFLLACRRTHPFIAQTDGIRNLTAFWRGKSYLIPLVIDQDALPEVSSWNHADAWDTLTLYIKECEYEFTSYPSYLAPYVAALKASPEANVVLELLQLSVSKLSHNDVFDALYPARAHFYRHPDGTLMFIMDFTISTDLPGCMRCTTCEFEPGTDYLSVWSEYIPE